MDIQKMRKKLQEDLRRSGLSETQITHLTQEHFLIARQARKEMETMGRVEVLCPNCQTHPTVSMSTEDNRLYVRCKCGYIASGEIYF